MRRTLLIFVLATCFTGPVMGHAFARAQSSVSAADGGQIVDGVAARIEDDVLTESELRELGAFQQLVDGSQKSRTDRIRELADQWIVRGEIEAAKYPAPSSADVDRAFDLLVAQFHSAEEFAKHRAAAGLSEAAIRRMLAQQLYLSRFLDYRFRAAAQVTSRQIEEYYRGEFAPRLKAKNQDVPPLQDVEDTIREVLIQRAINDRAAQWLDDTRARLKIDVIANGVQP